MTGVWCGTRWYHQCKQQHLYQSGYLYPHWKSPRATAKTLTNERTSRFKATVSVKHISEIPSHDLCESLTPILKQNRLPEYILHFNQSSDPEFSLALNFLLLPPCSSSIPHRRSFLRMLVWFRDRYCIWLILILWSSLKSLPLFHQNAFSIW